MQKASCFFSRGAALWKKQVAFSVGELLFRKREQPGLRLPSQSRGRHGWPGWHSWTAVAGFSSTYGGVAVLYETWQRRRQTRKLSFSPLVALAREQPGVCLPARSCGRHV